MNSLKSLKNEYEGERVFLIGNGPSLAETPLEMLDDEYTIGVNKINHIYEDTEWRPSFYVLSQMHLRKPNIKKFVRENINLGISCFLNSNHKTVFGERENVYYFDVRHDRDPELHEAPIEEVENIDIDYLYEYWSEDVTEVAYSYHTMYCVMQLVFYMGFEEIYFVGCDLGFGYHDPHMVFQDGLDPLQFDGNRIQYLKKAKETEGKSVIKSLINSAIYNLYKAPLIHKAPSYALPVVEAINGKGDKDHFSSNYRKRPRDNRKNNEEITRSHVMARRIAEDKNIQVFNATIGGELEVYPRVDIQDII